MSTAIENRVVSMEFDNAKFEKGVQETLKSLEKLNDTIDKATGSSSESQKAFSALAKAFGNVSFDRLASQVDAIAGRFSNMGIVGATAIAHITEQAVTAGERLVKSLSVDQIFAGWGKYNEKTSSVQTIMNATGESIDVVNSKLEKLMWFTDETSYDFVDMVSNIGKFTSNGIALDDAVTSMQGIANWAAVSGQNAQTASRAMYNLSQALGMGSVKVQDWMSIENANMATAQFKQAAMDAAVAVGTLRKESDGTYKTIAKGSSKATEVTVENFRTTLQDGWFDSETLTMVLSQYGDVVNVIKEVSDATGASATDILKLVDAEKEGSITNEDYVEALGEADIASEDFEETVQALKDGISELAQEEYEFGIKAFQAGQEAKTFEDAINATKDAVSSGWMKTFELIFGDYEKAKVLWTDLANDLWDIFAIGGEARNALLAEATSEGWDTIAKKIVAAGGDIEEFQSRLEAVAWKHGLTIYEWEREDGGFVETLKRNWLSTDLVVETLEKMNTGIDAQLQSADMTMEEFLDIYNRILNGDFGQGTPVVSAQLEALGYDAEKVINLKNLMLAGYSVSEESLKGLKTEVVETSGAFDDLIEDAKESGSEFNNAIVNASKANARELFIGGAKNLIESIQGTIDAFKTAWSNVFPSVTADTIRDIAGRFNSFTESLKNAITGSDKFQMAFQGVFAIVKSVGNVFNALFQIVKPLGSVFIGLGSVLIGAFATFGRITEAVGRLTRGFNPLLAIAKAFGGVIEAVITALKNLAAPLVEGLGSKVTLKITHGLTELVGKLQSFANIASTAAWQSETAEKIVNKLRKAFEKLKNLKWKDLAKKIGLTDETIAKVESKIKSLKETLMQFKSDTFAKVTSTFQKVKDDIGKFFDDKLSFKEMVSGWAKSLKEAWTARVDEIIHSVKTKLLKSSKSLQETQAFLKAFKAFDNFKQSLSTFKTNAFTKISDGLTRIKTDILSVFNGETDFETVLSGWFGDVSKWVKEKFEEIQEAVKNFDATETISSISEKISTIFSEAIHFVLGDNSTLPELINSLLGSIFSNGLNLSKILSTLAGAFALFQGGKLLRGLGNLGGMFESIGGYFDALTAEKKGNKFKDTAEGIKDIAIALGIVAAAFVVLANMDSEKATVGAKRLATILGEVVIAFALINLTIKKSGTADKIKDVGTALLEISVAVIILVKAMKMLDKIEDYKGSMLKLLGLMGSIALLQAALNAANLIPAKTKTSALGLIGAAYAIKILAGVLGQIDEVAKNGADIGGAITVIQRLGIALALLAAVAGKSGMKLSNGLGLVATAASLKIVVNTLIDLTKYLKKLKPEDAADFHNAQQILKEVAVIVGVLAIALGFSNVSVKDILGLAAVVGSIYAVITALEKLQEADIKPNTISQLAIVMGIVLGSLLALSVVMAALAPALQALILPLLEFAGVLAAIGIAVGVVLGSVALGLAALGKGIEGFTSGLDNSATLLKSFLDKIPGILDSIAIIANTEDAFVNIAKAFGLLTEMFLGQLIIGLISGIGTLSYLSLIAAIESLEHVLNTVTESGIIGKLESLGDVNADEIGDGYSVLNHLFFNTGWDSILAGAGDFLGDYDSIPKAATAISTAVATINDNDLINGLVSMGKGDEDAIRNGYSVLNHLFFNTGWDSILAGIGDFLGDYDSMSEAIASLSTVITTINDNNLIGSLVAIGYHDAAQILKGHTIIGAMIGASSLSSIVSEFGDLFGDYDKMKTAVEKLSEVITVVEEQDLFTKLKSIGEQDDEPITEGFHKIQNLLLNSAIDGIITGIGNVLGNYRKMASSMKSLADTVNVINDNDLITELNKLGLTDTSSAVKGLNNINAIFASNVWDGLKVHKDSVIDVSQSSAISNVGKQLSELSQYTSSISTVITDLSDVGSDSAKTAADVMTTLFSKSKNGGKTLTDVANEAVGTDFTILGSMAEALGKFSSVTSTIQEMGNVNGKGISDFIDAVANLFKKPEEVSGFAEAGISMMEELAAGMQSGLETILTTVDEVVKAAMSETAMYVNSTTPSWNDAGVAAAEGFRLGIHSKIQEVANEAAEMVRQAILAAKNAEESNSPSKVFRQLGDYAGQGYALGFKDETANVTAQATNMVDGAVKVAQTTSQLIQNALDSDFVPTITPVIDTSGISSGLSTIGSMTAGMRGVTLASSISGRMNAIQNTQPTPQVVTLDTKSLASIIQQNNSDINANVTVNYTGTLAQLATILQPSIQVETNRRGMSVIKGVAR